MTVYLHTNYSKNQGNINLIIIQSKDQIVYKARLQVYGKYPFLHLYDLC